MVAYCTLSWAGAFFHLILFAFLRRDVQAGLELSPSALGWIDGLTFAAAALGGIVLGRAADRGARRAVIAMTPVIPAIGAVLLASADSLEAVVIARVLAGFGVGGGWGVGHAIIADLYDGRARLRAAAVLQTGGPLGVIAAAALACLFIPDGDDGWRRVVAWSAATAAIALFDPIGMRGAAAVARPARPREPSLLRSAGRPALFLLALLALQMTAYWCTFGWLPGYLRSAGASRSAIGWMQIATGATQALADLLFGVVAPRLGVRRLFVACNLAFAAGVLALAFAFGVVADHPAALVATVAAIGLGSGAWAAYGPLYARHVAADIRASVSATSYHVARATQLVVQPAAAALCATSGAPAAPLFLAAVAATSAAFLIRAVRDPMMSGPSPS